MAPIEKGLAFQRSTNELERIFAFLESVAQEAGLGERDKYALDFAVEELFTNFVKYNNSQQPIEIEVSVGDGELKIHIEDRDVSDFDPATAEKVRVEAGVEERTPGGLGLHLVRSLFRSLRYHYRDGVLEVVAVKKLENSDSEGG